MSPSLPQLPLGKLERIDVRQVWLREDGSFTPWLAQEENIKLLGNAIGMDLEVEAQEKWVGPFRADILCKNTANDSWVLVENQLEKTDHIHLGQLLTYAAGLSAVTIVWISPKFTDEHRAALDWLNKITNDSFNFFGLEIEAWRISGSPVAPKFNIISQPNDWTKTIADTAKRIESGALSGTQQLQVEYWTALRELVESKTKILRMQKPLPQNWTNLSIGRSGAYMTATISTQQKWIGVDILLHGPSKQAFFEALEFEKVPIESEIGSALQWRPMPEKKESHIGLYLEPSDPGDKADWPQQHEWLLNKLEAFHRAFAQRVKGIVLSRIDGPVNVA